LEVNGTAQTANDNGADINSILEDTGTTIPGTIATMQADLDNPSQYKADVSALAIEANVQGHAADALTAYGPATSTEMTEIKGATWSAPSDTLEGIRNSIVDANPQNHSATANNETTGTLDSGTFADTASINTTYWQSSPVTPAVGGFGLNVDLTFGIGTGRVPDQLTVTGYFNSGALRTVQVWAYDYNIAAYVQLSSSVNDFGNGVANQTFQYPLTNNMVEVASGAVQIRFTSTSTTIGDDWYCDAVIVSSVAQEASGLTSDAIQAAVWGRAGSGHDESTLGYNLSKVHLLQGDIVSATSASQFIIDAGVAVNDAYNGMLIMLEDKTDDHYEVRRIVDYIGATNEVFVDRDFGFTPVALDDYYLMSSAYMDVNVTHVGGTAQTANDNGADINSILEDTGTTIPGTITTAQNDLNTLTGADGATLASAQGNYAPNVVVPDVAGTAATLHGVTDGKIDAVDVLADAIKAVTDNLPNSGALNEITVANILAGIIEGAYDLKECLRLLLSFAAGKASGGGTTSIAFRDTADTKDRIVLTVDEAGDRSAVTIDAS